jgi:hypothetical protein
MKEKRGEEKIVTMDFSVFYLQILIHSLTSPPPANDAFCRSKFLLFYRFDFKKSATTTTTKTTAVCS